MRNRARVGVLASALACMGSAAGVAQTTPPASEPAPATGVPDPVRSPVHVVVTLAPLESFVEPLVPKGSTTRVLIKPGKSEHGYEFTPSDLAAIARADVVLYIGLGLDSQVEQAVKEHGKPGQRAVCFADAAGIHAPAQDEHAGERGGAGGGAGGEATDHHDHVHEHEHDHEHDHERGVDPHLWLDPSLVILMLPEIERALRGGSSHQSGASAVPSAAYESLLGRVRAMDEQYRARLAPFAGSRIVTHHAAFARLAERYGLGIAAVIMPPGASEGTPGAISRAVLAIKEQGARAVFFEPQYDATIAAMIAERAGVGLGTLDPIGDGDWFAMMQRNLDQLVETLTVPEEAPQK